MKQRNLFALWGGMFIVCAGLGFIPEVSGVWRGVLTVVSLLFFVPGGVLVYQAARSGDKRTLRLVRNLSALSLALTLIFLVLNLMTALRPELVGDFLYYVLVIVSTPMVCGGYWAGSLFLWACLLVVSWKKAK